MSRSKSMKKILKNVNQGKFDVRKNRGGQYIEISTVTQKTETKKGKKNKNENKHKKQVRDYLSDNGPVSFFT